MSSGQLQAVIQQAQKLSPAERLQLIKHLAESLTPQPVAEPRYLIYGEFRNSSRPMSTEEDFKLAEWRPTEEELDGD